MLILILLSVCGFISLFLFELRKGKLISTFFPWNVWFLVGIVFLASGWIVVFKDHFYFGVFMGLTALARVILGGTIAIALGIAYLRLLTRNVSAVHYYQDSMDNSVFVSGAYGWCRHPGFYIFVLFSLSLALCGGSLISLFYCVWTSILNTVYIVIQDIWWFPCYIKGYEAYKKKVYFLAFWKRERR